MTDRDALKRLIEAQASGATTPWVDAIDPLGAANADLYGEAQCGSLDAALSLKEALLPGWFPGMSQNIHTGFWYAWVQDNSTHYFSSVEATPARALLLATLKAYMEGIDDRH